MRSRCPPESKELVALKPEALAQFINTKLTAKLNHVYDSWTFENSMLAIASSSNSFLCLSYPRLVLWFYNNPLSLFCPAYSTADIALV